MPKKKRHLSHPHHTRPSRVRPALAKPDWYMFTIIVSLLVFGFLMVFDASYVDALNTFSDPLFFVKRQAIWGAFGLLAAVSTVFLPLSFLKRIAKPFFVLSLILLVAVLLPGLGQKIYGARRWINLGSIVFQPSELIKVAAILYFPSWLIYTKRLGPFIGLLGITLALIMLEPDMGTAFILTGICGAMYFFAQAPLRRLAVLVLGLAAIGIVFIVVSPYRMQRVKTFLNPSQDPLGASYHIRQVLLSFGSGGWWGTGLGRSRQKYQYLPEASTDSIFAVIAEELGLGGGLAVIAAFALIALRGLSQAQQVSDPYAQLVAIGAIAWITAQALFNLASMVALVPLTGVPLPFVSYGGSSLVTSLTAVGLYVNASRFRAA